MTCLNHNKITLPLREDRNRIAIPGRDHVSGRLVTLPLREGRNRETISGRGHVSRRLVTLPLRKVI